MASGKEYLHFILEQLSDLDDISYRPMMGEFILYYRGKIVGGIYDDRLLVKKTRSALELMPAAICELPYEGAKEMLLVDEVDSKVFLTKGSVWQTYPTAGSISCTFPLNRLHRCRSSGNARSIRRLKITVLFCITPISVPTPIIGYQGCRRWRRNMVSRSRPSISLTKNLHRMYPHRSRPMPCSGTVSF